MKQDTYVEYAKIRKQREELEKEEALLLNVIIEEMKERKVVKETFEFGSFTVAHRTNYTYSNKVKELVEKVKLAQLKEVEKGTAKAKVTNYLIFKPNA